MSLNLHDYIERFTITIRAYKIGFMLARFLLPPPTFVKSQGCPRQIKTTTGDAVATVLYLAFLPRDI